MEITGDILIAFVIIKFYLHYDHRSGQHLYSHHIRLHSHEMPLLQIRVIASHQRVSGQHKLPPHIDPVCI